MERFTIILIITIVAILESLSHANLKYVYNTKKNEYFLISVILYAIICYLLYIIYHYKTLASATALWSGMSIILALFLGWKLFNEHLTPADYIGIILITIGIYFITFEGLHAIQTEE